MSHDGVIEPRDELQARVVERLRAAHGAPVSFEELRAMGIENPALFGYELAAAGIPIEQARETGGRALALPPAAPEGGEDGTDVQPAGAAPERSARSVVAALAAGAGLAAVLAAVLALTLSAHPARRARLSADHQPRRLTRSVVASAGNYAAQARQAGASGLERAAPSRLDQRAPSVAVSPAAAASLETAGHQLLAQSALGRARVLERTPAS